MFFEEIKQIMGNNKLLMIIHNNEDETLTISISPTPRDKEDKKRLSPIVATGTPMELDSLLCENLKAPMQKLQSLTVNAEKFIESVNKAEKEVTTEKAKDIVKAKPPKAPALAKPENKALAEGDALMEEKRYAEAIQAYLRASKADAKDESITKKLYDARMAKAKTEASLFGEEEPAKEPMKITPNPNPTTIVQAAEVVEEEEIFDEEVEEEVTEDEDSDLETF